MNFRRRIAEDEGSFQVAPMIDVMFILLIFFLATAALSELESELDITLPVAREAEAVDRGPRDVVVNVRRDGVMVVNRQPIAPARLREILTQLHASNPDQGVIIRADREALHEFVIEVMDICRQAGIANVAFPVVQERAVEGGS